MHVIGPHGRPLDQEHYVVLADKYGSTDYTYYLFIDGTIWCFESPNNGYSPCRWVTIEPERMKRIIIDGKTLQQLVEEHRSSSGGE
jgi:hypothetical protein